MSIIKTIDSYETKLINKDNHNVYLGELVTKFNK